MRSWPLPSQRGQVSIGVPGSAPFPLQCSQPCTASKATSTLVPAATSARSISAVTATSPPCMAPPLRPPPKTSPPKKASKMSENEPKPSNDGA